MAAKFITRESWSRCETPSMLYDAVRRPNTINNNALPKDTIETTQRLKQERINKLDSKGLELPHESYVAVVQVGKYMFFTVMLPVYLCCYGIPRWFVVNALQPLFDGVKNQAYNLGRHIVEMNKQVTDLMKGLLEQLIGNALRMSKDRGKNLLRHLLRRFRNASEKFSNASKTAKKRLKEIKDSAAKSSKQLFKQAEGRVSARNARMRQKILNFAKRSAAWWLKVLKVLDEMILTPMMKIVSLPFKLLGYLLKRTKIFLLLILRKAKEQLKRALGPVIAFMRKGLLAVYMRIKKAFAAAIRPIVKGIKAVQAILARYYQKVRKTVLEPVTAAAAKIALKIKNWLSAGIRKIKQLLGVVFSPLKPVAKRIKATLGRQLSRAWQYVKPIGRKSASMLAKALQSMLSKVLQFGKKLAQEQKEKVLGIFHFWSRLFQMAFQALTVVARGVTRVIGSSFMFLGFIATKAIFTVQIVITIIGMSFTGGFELVKETASDL
jgi:hypothetical protein